MTRFIPNIANNCITQSFISRLATQQSLGSCDLQPIPLMGRATGVQLMTAIKKNKASNQCNSIVPRFNVGITRVQRGDLPLYIKLTISLLSPVRHYIFHTLHLEKDRGSVVDANHIQQQQMAPCIWTISGRPPASQKITHHACRKIQYVVQFQNLY